MLLIDFLFVHGAPGAVVVGWADDCVDALNGAEALGADKKTAPVLTMPPFPAANDSGAIRTYLAETWRVIANTQKVWGGPKSEARLAYARILALPPSRSPQAMIADAIKVGPMPTTAGADRWYKLASYLANYVKGKTGEPTIASSAGLIAAQAFALAAQAIKAGAQHSPAALASRAAGGAAQGAKQAAALVEHTQARALEAAKAVIAVPGDIADKVTDVPKHLADQLASTADHYIEAAKEVVPGVADAAARASLGFGVGVTVVGGLVVLGLGAVFLGPELLAAGAAGKAATSKR